MNTDLTLERLPATARRPTNGLSVNNNSILSRLIPKDKWYKFTIFWSLTQLLFIGILEGVVMKIHYDYIYNDLSNYSQSPSEGEVLLRTVPNAKALIVYQALFICAQAFQFFLCIDAIYSLSMIQLVATAIFNWALFAYSIMQYQQAANVITENIAEINPKIHPTKQMEIIVIVLMSVFSTVWAYLAYKLYNLFGWKLYKEMGADMSLMKSLRLYHIYTMLLKLDVFFFFGFDIQFLVLVLIQRPGGGVGMALTIVHAALVVPLTPALLAVAYFAVRKERRSFTIVTLLGFFGGIIFLIYMMVDARSNTEKYLNSKNSITFFSNFKFLF